MGLLSEGEPLSWDETKSYSEHVHTHGIQQFVNLYRTHKHRTNDPLKWGEEVEYMVVKFDRTARKVRLSIRASTQLLHQLQQSSEQQCAGSGKTGSLWHHEFAAYMLEAIPAVPYSAGFNSQDGNVDGICTALNTIEHNMRQRRAKVHSLLHIDEALLAISVFPRLGTYDCYFQPAFVQNATDATSLFFPDQAINQGHPRFRTLSKHITERRGGPANIQVPIYRDVNTPFPFKESFFKAVNYDHSMPMPSDIYRIVDKRERQFGQPEHIYMDAMGFGMGCCCLQVTIQAASIDEARLLYDQLTALCPILLALTAASPAFKGYLTEVDTRWGVIAASVDDRTENERTGFDCRTGVACQQISKSRYDSVDMYISPGNEVFNDVPVPVNQRSYDMLLGQGVDQLLARHIAHLFIRDPLVVYREKINLNDTSETDHFENIQSTNWQTMRFKPPPSMQSPETGWRVEIRPMELQLTDSMNTAFVIFVVLITRLVLSCNLNLVIPMSKVETNMKEAQKRDAACKSKFWFPRNTTLANIPRLQSSKPSDLCVQLSIDEIINGQDCDTWLGLVPLMHKYLDSVQVESATRQTLNSYLEMIEDRARGNLPTPACTIRRYVMAHPEYRHDSVLSDAICYDLLSQLADLQEDRITMTQFMRNVHTMENKTN